jgi:tripartite-type tricarboxylate transporter receptor subunit TctC
MQFATTRRAAFALLAAESSPRLAAAAPAIDGAARIIVGAAPGGGADTVARLLAEPLSGRYATQVIVVNRPGASSRLAVEAVKAAAPDGTTILLGPMPVLTLFPHVLPRTTRYDTLADFTPVTTIGELAYGFAVNADHPALDLASFLAWTRQRQGATFAPPVLGAPQHMLGVALARQAGVNFTLVPYRDASQAVQDLLGGRIDCHINHMAVLAPQVRGSRLRLLAVSSEGRLPGFPEVPTFAEQGFATLTGSEAFSVMLPARAPDSIVVALHTAIEAVVAVPMMRERLARLEITPMVLSPQATAARVRTEFAAWGPVVATSGFKAEE